MISLDILPFCFFYLAVYQGGFKNARVKYQHEILTKAEWEDGKAPEKDTVQNRYRVCIFRIMGGRVL